MSAEQHMDMVAVMVSFLDFDLIVRADAPEDVQELCRDGISDRFPSVFHDHDEVVMKREYRMVVTIQNVRHYLIPRS